MSVKTKKILVFMLTAVMMLAVLGTTVFAAPTDVVNTMKGTMVDGEETATPLAELGGKILGILQVAGVIIGTIILVVLGFKYMMGSLEEKAEYKKTMIPYVVGAVIIMAGPTIASGVFTLVSNLGK